MGPWGLASPEEAVAGRLIERSRTQSWASIVFSNPRMTDMSGHPHWEISRCGEIARGKPGNDQDSDTEMAVLAMQSASTTNPVTINIQDVPSTLNCFVFIASVCVACVAHSIPIHVLENSWRPVKGRWI
jgi:hypothetical protein